MEQNKISSGKVCDKIVKIFLERLAETQGLEEVAGRLEAAIANKKPTEASIRSALFEEEIS